jgi:hypothetical protein
MIRGVSYETQLQARPALLRSVSLKAEMQHTNTIRIEYVQFL